MFTDISPGHISLWRSLKKNHPLPSNIRIINSPDKADIIITLKPFWRRPDDGGNHRYLRWTFLTPAVFLWDKEESISQEEVDQFPQFPASEITPPLRGILIEGMGIDHPHYPLVSGVRISLDLRQTEKSVSLKEIKNWFTGLPLVKTLPRPQIYRIGAVGDIMPGRGVQEILIGHPGGLKTIFSDTLPVLKGADLLLGNLEGTLTEGGKMAEKSYRFKFSPKVLGPLNQAGFDYLSLTNNHSFDYGIEGFLNSLEALKTASLGTSGAGINLDQASLPWSAGRKGHEVRILSVGAYPREKNGFDGKTTQAGPQKPGILWQEEDIYGAMKKGFSKNTYNIVMVHGGEEYKNHPNSRQIQLYQSLIRQGADLVLGSHPHVLQGIQAYRGKIIAYSLGNFIFPGMEEIPRGEESVILRADLYQGKVLYLNIIPVRIQGKRIKIDTTGEILKRVKELSRKIYSHGETNN